MPKGHDFSLYGWQRMEIAKLLKDEITKNDYIRKYKNYTFQLRKEFNLQGGMQHFSQQLLVDEIALATLRIQEMERWLLKESIGGQFKNDVLEAALIRAKEQRRKTLETLLAFATGKKKLYKGDSYRDKMIRSKKYEAVLKAEKIVDEQIRPQEQPEESPPGEMEDSSTER